MITPLQFPIYRQGNPLWSGQRLGTVNGTTLGSYGCLVSSLAMVSSALGQLLNPAQVDDLFTNNRGYANGNLVIWNAVPRLLPQLSPLGVDYCESTAAPIAKIKGHLDAGGLALLRVNFNGVAGKMHWVVADGYNGDNIIKADPWYGDETDFTSRNAAGRPRYGTGDASRDILEVHYFGDAFVPSAPIAPPATVPVTKLPDVIPPEIVAVPTPDLPNGQVTAEVPVTVIPTVPSYQDTYTVQPGSKVVLRAGYVPLDAEKGLPFVYPVAIDYVMKIAGYFTYEGREYARSELSTLVGAWRGLSVDAFLPPNGQASGDVRTTVVEPVPSPPVPTAPTVGLWVHVLEALSRFIAALINKRSSN